MQTIDIFDFARRCGSLSGTFSVADMPELAALLADDSGEVRWEVEGLGERRGHPAARLRIEADANVPCIFCNGPVPVTYESEAVFLIVASEAEADAMPIEEDGEDEDVIVGSKRFSLLDWVREEAILSLPGTVQHEEGCEGTDLFEETQAEADAEVARAKAERPNPFAALAGLKTGK